MSRRPGIGANWLDKYYKDVYTTDNVIIDGKKGRPPKYYDDLYSKMFPDHMAEIKEQREIDAYELRHDNTPERLKVKETVQRAKINFFKRDKA